MNRPTAARRWGIVTAALGAATLLRPTVIARIVSSGATPSRAVIQVLGGRQLLQGVAVAVAPGRRVLVKGAIGVDAVHAASMVAVARWRPRYRRPALSSAAIAGLSAIIGAVLSRSTQP